MHIHSNNVKIDEVKSKELRIKILNDVIPLCAMWIEFHLMERHIVFFLFVFHFVYKEQTHSNKVKSKFFLSETKTIQQSNL